MRNMKVTLVHSLIGRPKQQRQIAHSLGLWRLQQTRVLPDNAAVRGMIRHVAHLVQIGPVAVNERARMGARWGHLPPTKSVGAKRSGNKADASRSLQRDRSNDKVEETV